MAVKKSVKVVTKPLTTAQRCEAHGIEEICERIAECVALHVIASDIGISKGSLIVWLATYPDQYARAREAQADKHAEDILAIADDGSNDTYQTDDGEVTNHDVIARSRLRVDARKWLASKMAPKKYGEKVVQEHTGPGGGAMSLSVSFVKP